MFVLLVTIKNRCKNLEELLIGYLGLIPSSLNSWGNAIRCLKPEGGHIHVRECSRRQFDEWTEKPLLGSLLLVANVACSF